MIILRKLFEFSKKFLIIFLELAIMEPENGWNRLPLHFAVMKRNVKLVKLFLKYYRMTEPLRDSNSETPLDIAIRLDYSDCIDELQSNEN